MVISPIFDECVAWLRSWSQVWNRWLLVAPVAWDGRYKVYTSSTHKDRKILHHYCGILLFYFFWRLKKWGCKPTTITQGHLPSWRQVAERRCTESVDPHRCPAPRWVLLARWTGTLSRRGRSFPTSVTTRQEKWCFNRPKWNFWPAEMRVSWNWARKQRDNAPTRIGV